MENKESQAFEVVDFDKAENDAKKPEEKEPVTKTPSEWKGKGPPPRPDIVITWRVVVAYLGILLGLFLAAIDNTIVATALPDITNEFHAANLYSWTIVAYLLTSTAVSPLIGRFSNIFGKKNVMLASIVIFLASSAVCGASVHIYMLIVFRAIQGIGGGGILSGALVIVADWFPPQQRAKLAAFLGMTFSVANIAGPVIGGAFSLKVSWRWVFYINLPAGGAALVLIWYFVNYEAEREAEALASETPNSAWGASQQKETLRQKLASIDYVGVIIILVLVICLVLGLSFGGSTYPWKSPAPIILLVATAPLFLLLLYWEGKVAKFPVIQLRMFKIRDVCISSISIFFLGALLTGLINYLPVYFQIIRGDNPIISGVKLIPIMVATVPTTIISGRVVGYNGYHYPWVAAGFTLMSIAGGLLVLLELDTAYPLIGFFVALIGLGLGCVVQILFFVTQSRVEPKDIPVASSLVTFFRTLGGVVGVAINQTIIANTLNSDLNNPALEGVINQGYQAIQQLPSAQQSEIYAAYLHGIHLVFYTAMGIGLAGLISGLMIDPKRLPCVVTQREQDKQKAEAEGLKKEGV